MSWNEEAPLLCEPNIVESLDSLIRTGAENWNSKPSTKKLPNEVLSTMSPKSPTLPINKKINKEVRIPLNGSGDYNIENNKIITSTTLRNQSRGTVGSQQVKHRRNLQFEEMASAFLVKGNQISMYNSKDRSYEGVTSPSQENDLSKILQIKDSNIDPKIKNT